VQWRPDDTGINTWAAIGVSLGLLGSGGSIITVPMLVYVAGSLGPAR
jgi:uncharacterized membrane protein YfcA